MNNLFKIFNMAALLIFLISCGGLIDLNTTSDEEGRVYNLRDTGPAGGYIFYVNPNWETDGWRYMEAMPEEDLIDSVWSNVNDSEVGTSESWGSGKTNTDAIIAQPDHSVSAAQACMDYSVTADGATYNNWFLPSLDELEKLYANLKTGTDEFSEVYDPVIITINGIWSSSESSGNPTEQAIVLNFLSSNQIPVYKSNTGINAFCVRSF